MKLQGRALCFARVGKSLVKCLILSEAFRGLVEKMRTSVLFDINRPFKRKNTLSLTDELFIKVSAARCSRFKRKIVLREKFSASARVGKSLAKCLLSAALR